MSLPPPEVLVKLLDIALAIWSDVVEDREVDLEAHLRRTGLRRLAALERARQRVRESKP